MHQQHPDRQPAAQIGASSLLGTSTPHPSVVDLPPAETTYLQAISTLLQAELQHHLRGVYLFGSAAYGEYEPGVSDLDLQTVIAEPLAVPTYRRIAASLQHERLACPARRLEFVLYHQGAVQPATRQPRFEMNYNTGSDVHDHLTLDATEEASHWFLLDIALGRERGLRLVGPPPADIFAPIPRRWQLEAIADSLTWHRDHEASSANSVLNACRGWRYAVTGEHGSKRRGAQWARQQPNCPAVVEQAEQRRLGGPPLAANEVSELTALVLEAVQQALRSA